VPRRPAVVKLLTPRVLREAVLGELTLVQLKKAVRDANIDADRRSRERMVERLAMEDAIEPSTLLAYLSEDNVKHVCDALGQMSVGRRSALVQQLLSAASEGSAAVDASISAVMLPALAVASGRASARAIGGRRTVDLKHVTLTPPIATPAIETNIIYCDDNRHRLLELPRESVDLIYLDPPFFSNRNYEVIWGDEAEVRSFEDRWEGGIHVYIEWMRERVLDMHRVLKPTGSFYLHCDWHAVHYLKQMCDDVFGAKQFQNEVIWYYRGAGVSPRRWGRRHDTLLFYTKGKKWWFDADPVRTAYASTTIERFKHQIGNVRGKADYGQQKLNPLGKHPDDVLEIPIVAPSDRQRLGYPTQKPPELLARVILASSKPGDVVLDPFAGCGTTLVVAQAHARKWIGIDISPTAVNLMKRRMDKVGAIGTKLVGLPVTVDELRLLKPFEFQNWVISRFNGTYSSRNTGDMGIDGLSYFHHYPIQVKQSDSVGRNVVDNFETAVERKGSRKGYIVGLSFTRGAYEEAARARSARNLDIQLITVAELLEKVPDLAASDVGDLIVSDLPLPPARQANARPSIEELVSSGRGA
jgi:DNA modification methylase